MKIRKVRLNDTWGWRWTYECKCGTYGHVHTWFWAMKNAERHLYFSLSCRNKL